MKKIREIWANRKVRFTVVSVIFILWFVVWTRNPWWLLGLLFIYDYYFTRFIDKIFLNKYRAFKTKHKGFKKAMEWVEALLFAMVVVIPLKLYFFGLYVIPSSSMENTLMIGDYLFVNKLNFGPKMPNTPISFPFVQHTLPLTKETKSWVDWIQFDYKRLKGFSKIKNEEVIVFQFPAGDTVALSYQNQTYYDLVRDKGIDWVYQNSKVIYRPVDKRENYIKRCVAIAGDSLEIVNGKVYINGKPKTEQEHVKYLHFVQTDGMRLGGKFFEDYKINMDEIFEDTGRGAYQMFLTVADAKKISETRGIVVVERYVDTELGSNATFPHDPERYEWNGDNYGPIWIPKAGATVKLTTENLPLYKRIIKNYELNDLQVNGDVIKINGVVANSYTFKMNYYFMMGDNRHNSADSRYWGFVPEDHIEGKAGFVWLSIANGKNIFTGLRWGRMFNKIR